MLKTAKYTPDVDCVCFGSCSYPAASHLTLQYVSTLRYDSLRVFSCLDFIIMSAFYSFICLLVTVNISTYGEKKLLRCVAVIIFNHLIFRSTIMLLLL